ncbi:hypothetical protein CEXT_815361 [Caerostris extrusa]|uniref:Uncharacterized protein n=1 Tax=Caerostris extrusa TaxID=172846 RepID=A0AAV4N1F9_CAEEX|nr:hypothetical protein CEXT_815361 [Caerostris extrusa]
MDYCRGVISEPDLICKIESEIKQELADQRSFWWHAGSVNELLLITIGEYAGKLDCWNNCWRAAEDEVRLSGTATGLDPASQTAGAPDKLHFNWEILVIRTKGALSDHHLFLKTLAVVTDGKHPIDRANVTGEVLRNSNVTTVREIRQDFWNEIASQQHFENRRNVIDSAQLSAKLQMGCPLSC